MTDERRAKGGDPGDPPQPGTGSDQRSGLLLLERLLGETAATELPLVSVLATEDPRFRGVECNRVLLLASLSLPADVAADEPLLHAQDNLKRDISMRLISVSLHAREATEKQQDSKVSSCPLVLLCSTGWGTLVKPF